MKLEKNNWEWPKEEAGEFAFENNVIIDIEDEDINSMLSTRLYSAKQNTDRTAMILKKYQKEIQETSSIFFSNFIKKNRVSLIRRSVMRENLMHILEGLRPEVDFEEEKKLIEDSILGFSLIILKKNGRIRKAT